MLEHIVIEANGKRLQGHLSQGSEVKAWVIFAHGSGSSHKSSRNNWVARALNQKGYGTLLFDLLTLEEDMIYENRFNIPLLAGRLLLATQWLMNSSHYAQQPLAYFGASTGAAAALTSAARAESAWPLFTVISRGGRPDLAGDSNLENIFLPVLLIVGDQDFQVIELNQHAADHLKNYQLSLIAGATHLFEEPGTLDEVVKLASSWLDQQLYLKKGEDNDSNQRISI